MTRRRGVNTTVLFGGLALVVPLVVLFAVSFGNDPHAVPSVLEGKEAPTFRLADLDGDTWDLAQLHGRPVVLNFWSTWCLPCKQEHALLQAAAQANPDVQFLGVIYSDEPDKARRYLAAEGTTYDHLVDPDGHVAIDYGVAGVPETFFVDPTGRIVHKQVGPLTWPAMQTLLGRVRGGS
jgi:cytochrome c biogenesis protein CcmG/thiol:disulfide interchange protein DsbE